MQKILEDISVSALVEAIEANLWEYGAYLGRSSQVELNNQVDMLWYATEIPSPMFNGVFRAQLSPSETSARIGAALGYFRSRKLPMMWWIGPSTRPIDLGQQLEAQGLVRSADMIGMATDLMNLEESLKLPAGLKIKHVGGIETLREWARPFAAAFGFTDATVGTLCALFNGLGLNQGLSLQHYIGYINGKPVACSSMFLGAGVAGIYNVATIPDERRKGIGAALTLEPLHRAREIGYRVGVLHSSQMGFSMYRKTGFEEYCRIKSLHYFPF